MTFNFDEEYRQSQEYKEWVAGIRRDYPSMPLYLIEQAIMAHKSDPQAYKKQKDAKEVFTKAPKQKVNQETKVVEGAITIEDAPIEEPTPSTTIEEVEA
jgi:hypothetical protein